MSVQLSGRKTSLRITPIDISEAKLFVQRHHRHHGPPTGARCAIACSIGDEVRGVAIIGRPTAREDQDGYTSEITRVCVIEGTPNACSMLYGACWRAAKALGYLRLITFTLQSESGSSLRGAGFRLIGERPGRSWNVPGRPRVDKHPTLDAPKYRWEAA